MNFGIGLSALQASQYAIGHVSQNLANANTEGYHRQEVGLQTRPSQDIRGQFVGGGVEVGEVRRIRDQIVESAFTNSLSDLSEIEQRLSIENRIESHFLTGEGSVQNALTSFFDELSRLSANPGEQVLRSSVVNQGVNLAQRVQQASSNLVELQDSVRRQLELEVNDLNQDIERLVEIQNRLDYSQVKGSDNGLLDQRDQLVNQIAQRIDVQRYESGDSQLALGFAGSSVSVGRVAIRFETVTADDGSMSIQVEGGDRPARVVSGKIAALLETQNTVIPEYRQKLQTFAQEIIQEVDQAHAYGTGIDGAFELLKGTRRVDDVSVPLNSAGIAFPVEAGELFISLTSPTGNRQTVSIEIDPETDSLESLAAKISGHDNIQAVVDPQTGQMSIIAEPGYRFDFSGELETTPELSGFSGTSIPTLSGQYNGDTNQTFTVRAVNDGTIGVTPGLLAEVVDADGQVIKQLELGADYEPGTELAIFDGVSVSFGVGEIATGDSFETEFVATPDTSGILSALGLNSFFQGRDSTDIKVSGSILADPTRLATSRNGEIGDTRNLAGLIELRHTAVLGDGRMTFDDFLVETSSEIGFRVQTSKSIQVNLAELNFQYQSERDSISGVDINEELLSLTQHQKSYEAAVQVVRTMEAMLDELFQIIR